MKGNHRHKYKGMSVSDWARKLNVPAHRIYNRLKSGWKWEDIVNCPFEQRTLMRYNGKTIREWSAEKGIRQDTIYARIKNGMSMQLAINSKVMQVGMGSPPAKRYDGLTLREWADKSGIFLGTIKARMLNGWDWKKAVTRPARKKITNKPTLS